ncbi:MAG: polyprenyl synthetase family protein [Deltaproteobacteria bacterium]|nr:polyprenyl synthetase family protein [Deltaproteobacteria bacterium]
MANIEKYIEENKNLINDFIKTHFKKRACNKKFPHNKFSLNDAILYTLATPGKRIRPIVLLITAESLGFPNKKRLLPFASSIELIHSYSLIHDDLPAMDNDNLRRGKPTNHIVFGEASAILAGDALLAEAFVILSDKEYTEGFDPKKIIEIIQELSYASGINGLAGGQFLDVNSFGMPIDFENIEYINKNKTASLIGAACAMGAILAGGDGGIVDNFKKFGLYLGLAFQTIDDILGITGNKGILGKTAGIDKANNKCTVASSIGLEKTYELINEYNEKALRYLSRTGVIPDTLTEFTCYLTNRIN